MSLAFLRPVGDAVARSPMERLAEVAGAQFEVRGGWNVALRYETGAGAGPVAWADMSHLPKWELRGHQAGRELGSARRSGEAWWCPVTGDRLLVLGGPAPKGALDITCNYAALAILGPQARETIARFCALDLRPHNAPPGSFRPGSIARQPGMVLVEASDRFLLLFGWALGEYMWTVVADAARQFGGRPVGAEAIANA